jgi:hypothetical protein
MQGPLISTVRRVKPRTQALERGAAAVPYSVPFWEHYAAHVVAKGADLEAVRRCERGGTAKGNFPQVMRASQLRSTLCVAQKRERPCLFAAGRAPARAVAAVHAHPRPPPPCSVFERGVAYCSTDYRAAPLWDAYIAFERGRGGPAAAAAVYARALQCPLESLDRLEAG